MIGALWYLVYRDDEHSASSWSVIRRWYLSCVDDCARSLVCSSSVASFPKESQARFRRGVLTWVRARSREQKDDDDEGRETEQLADGHEKLKTEPRFRGAIFLRRISSPRVFFVAPRCHRRCRRRRG